MKESPQHAGEWRTDVDVHGFDLIFLVTSTTCSEFLVTAVLEQLIG